MFDLSTSMDLGDIFNNTFKLIKNTIGRNIIIAIVFIIPTGVFMAYGMESFYNLLFHITKDFKESGSGNINFAFWTNLIEGTGYYLFTVFIFSLGYLAASNGITKLSYEEMFGNKLSLGSIYEEIFSKIYLKSVGQILLLLAILGSILTSSIFISVILLKTNNDFYHVLGVLLLIICFPLTLYFYFRWYFALTSIVCEDKGVFEAFPKSSFLVKDYWWRTFGTIILFTIIIQFAISIISTPVSFSLMWNYFSKYFSALTEQSMNKPNPAQFFENLKSIGFTLGLITILGKLLSVLIEPLFRVVMYVDLKIKKNDIEIAPPQLSVDTGTGSIENGNEPGEPQNGETPIDQS